MNKNKNTERACRLIVRVATTFLLMTGVLVTARAADEPAEPQQPQIDAPGAVDVEVFKGARILRTPSANLYPVEEMHDGREGWVELNMMIDPKGRPYEVTVIGSSGNPAFEKAAVKALRQFSFEPARRGKTPIDSSLTFKMKFAIASMARGASSDFRSAYEELTKAIDAADKDKADVQLARLKPQNLYEEAFTNFSKYFYHLKWGTPAERLTDLRLAIAGERRPDYLPKDTFTTALIAMFTLEAKAQDYGAALGTWEILEPIAQPGVRKDLQRAVDQIHAIQLGDQPLILPGAMGQSSRWAGRLFRNRFSIAVKSGAVSEIKLRCQQQYLFFKYEPGVQYSVGSRKGLCGIEVVGDPETTFELIQ